MAGNKTSREMLAELAREAGLLIVVFIPVDGLISSRWSWGLIALFVLGIVLIIVGIMTEVKRDE
jgi:hypothetical protein